MGLDHNAVVGNGVVETQDMQGCELYGVSHTDLRQVGGAPDLVLGIAYAGPAHTRQVKVVVVADAPLVVELVHELLWIFAVFFGCDAAEHVVGGYFQALADYV